MLKGWTTYHLTIVGAFTALLLLAGINALIMKNSGGYEILSEAELPYNIDQLWQWTVENDKRIKWQVSMHDMANLHGNPTDEASTRMLFFLWGEKSWTGVETTLEAVPPTKWLSQQDTQTSKRIYTITLTSIAPCKTVVRMHESNQLYNFTERFWIFWNKSEQQERLDYSLRQLKTWMAQKGEACP